MSNSTHSSAPNHLREYYLTTAHHYDTACAADSRLRDTEFYLEAAKSVSGTVLEVGCGTGRILLSAARAGAAIDGLDLSPALLGILREKLEREAPEVKARVNLHEGDMRCFALGKTFDLVMVPFRPMQHLFTVEDQLAAFRSIHSHLNPGGRLAFNVFYPNFRLLEETGTEHVELEWTDPLDSSITVQRSFLRKHVDKLNQFFEGEFIFRSYRGEQQTKEERSVIKLSYYTYPHLLLLFKSTGFRIREEYGSYDKEPISVCHEMIFILEKI